VVRLLTDQTVWLVLAAGVLGVLLPDVGARLQGAVLPLLAVMVVGVGITETPRTLLGRRAELLPALVVVAVQMTVLPLLAFGLFRALPAGDGRLGLLIVGLAPAEVTSALATRLAHGSAGLALRLLALSLLVSTVSIPLWLALLTTAQRPVSGTTLFGELVVAVVLPLVGAAVVRARVPRVGQLTERWSALSALAVVVLVFIVAGGLRQLRFDGGLVALGAALIGLVGLCYGLGLVLAGVLRLAHGQRRAVLFTTGMREFGVAAAVATSVVSTQAGAVAAVYGLLMMTSSFWVVGWLQRREAGLGKPTTVDQAA
jgi:BASS family bile acid:Na+ symporter